MKFYRSREKRTRPPPPDGKTPIYDFDEWSKQHYGAMFARDMYTRSRRNARQRTYEHADNMRKCERVVAAFFVVTLMIFYAGSRSNDYDMDKKR